MPLLGKIQSLAPAILGQYQINNSFFHQYPTSAMLSDGAHTAVTTSKNHALIWNIPEGTLRSVLPCPFLRAVSENGSSTQSEQNNGFFSRMWHYGASLMSKSYNNMIMNPCGNCLVSVTTDGHAVQVWDISEQDPTAALEQLSVLQIALLREIQQRIQTGGQRLILRPGSDNYQAYLSLCPIIKNAVKPYIGIYTGR